MNTVAINDNPVRAWDNRRAEKATPGGVGSTIRGSDHRHISLVTTEEASRMATPNDTPDLPEQFRYAVDSAGCWIWQGYCDANGYARIYNRRRRRIEWAHRFSYERNVGPIREGHEIDHTCQVVNCVNPDHLQQLTRAEHIRVTMTRAGKDDLHLAAAHLRRQGCTYSEIAQALKYMGREGAHAAVQAAVAKGLIDPDEVPPTRVLNSVEREEIRDLVAIGIPQTVVGRFYGVDSSHVSRVSRGVDSRGRRAV